MVKPKYALFALTALGVFACSAMGQDFVKGRLIVKFRSVVTKQRSDELVHQANGKIASEMPALGLQVIELPANANEKAQARAFGQHSEVEFAEPDYKYKASAAPNDPSFGTEWHLSKILAPSAWDLTQGSSSVVIAILDSGILASHEDLQNQIVPGWNFQGGNSDTSDVNGHGTMVAGVAAAATNNATGISGVGWNCKIMPLRVSDSSGVTSASMLVAALQYAADHGAKVANISFPASGSSTVASGAQYFMSKGGVVAMSSGNTAAFDSTADNPYVLSVSATDGNDNVASFSTTGNFIDLSAPGDGIYTTMSNGGYGYGSGTSFCAPVVAGVAALMYSVNPNLSANQVYNLIKQNADDLGPAGWDPGYGAGRVNAYRAVLAAKNTAGQDLVPPAVSFAAPTASSTVSGMVSVFCSASDNTAVDRVMFYADGTLVGTAYSPPYSWSWNSGSVVDGSHTLKAVAYDLAGNSGQASEGITVRNTIDTQAPTCTITSPTGGTVSGKFTVAVSASDNVNVMKVDLLVDGVLSQTMTRSPYKFSLNAKTWSKGGHTLQARASDPAGNLGWSQVVTITR